MRCVCRTRDFAHTVVIDGADASDNYFHLAPQEERVLQVEPRVARGVRARCVRNGDGVMTENRRHFFVVRRLVAHTRRPLPR